MMGHNTVAGSTIEVGMGATILCWTDRHAGTVIEWNGKTIVVQEDTATRTDKNGMDECQEYTYTRNPNGARHVFKLDRKGGFRAMQPDPVTGKLRMAKRGNGHGLAIGERDAYHDYSF